MGYTSVQRWINEACATSNAGGAEDRSPARQPPGLLSGSLALTEGIRLDPRGGQYLLGRGAAYHAAGDLNKAIADYSAALLLNPELTDAYQKRGYVYNVKGEYDKAIADYTEVIRRNPNDAEPHGSLAWLLATCPEKRFR